MNSKNGIAYISVVIGTIVTGATIVTIHQQLQTRKTYFQQAENAYQQADCKKSLDSWESLQNTSNWLEGFDRLSEKATEVKKECKDFLFAQEQANNTSPDKGLLIVNDYIDRNENKQSPLEKPIRQQAYRIFSNNGSMKLATLETCPHLDSLRDNNLIPNEKNNLAFFQLGCGKQYEKTKNDNVAVGYYQDFLHNSPHHDLAYQAKTSLLTMSVSCNKLDYWQQDRIIAKISDFLPVLYWNCGQEFANNILEYPKALRYFQNLEANYPKHPLVAEAKTATTQINKDVGLIVSQMEQANSTFTNRTIGCAFAGSIPGVSLIIDIVQASSGKSCSTGQTISQLEKNYKLVILACRILCPFDKNDLNNVKSALKFIKLGKAFAKIYQTNSVTKTPDTQKLSEFITVHQQDIQTLANFEPQLQRVLQHCQETSQAANLKRYRNSIWTKKAIDA